jgi:hypothetical protein
MVYNRNESLKDIDEKIVIRTSIGWFSHDILRIELNFRKKIHKKNWLGYQTFEKNIQLIF